MEKKKQKIEISLEKLKLISEYYEFPLAVFFMSEKELRKMKKKYKTRVKHIQKELDKLKKIRQILEDD